LWWGGKQLLVELQVPAQGEPYKANRGGGKGKGDKYGDMGDSWGKKRVSQRSEIKWSKIYLIAEVCVGGGKRVNISGEKLGWGKKADRPLYIGRFGKTALGTAL